MNPLSPEQLLSEYNKAITMVNEVATERDELKAKLESAQSALDTYDASKAGSGCPFDAPLDIQINEVLAKLETAQRSLAAMRGALEEMLDTHGDPAREEWLTHEAFEHAKWVHNKAGQALAGAPPSEWVRREVHKRASLRWEESLTGWADECDLLQTKLDAQSAALDAVWKWHHQQSGLLNWQTLCSDVLPLIEKARKP